MTRATTLDAPAQRSKALCGLFLLLLSASQVHAEVTVATVGDSLADSVYLGLKLQPDLLRKDGIKLVRWSRPSIGLTRVDYFDYTTWLRDTASLGSVDFCVVEMGANDLQSISTGDGKWLRVGTDAWQRAYTDRVRALVQTLKPQRCANVVWLLQPAYVNKFLRQYHGMINAVQAAGSASGADAFEIDAAAGDYGPDGIHPNKDFSFKLGHAVATLVAAMSGSMSGAIVGLGPQPVAGSNCATCHAAPGPSPAGLSLAHLQDLAPLIPRH